MSGGSEGEDGPVGCRRWADPTACDAGESCADGVCVSGCADECDAVGARRCQGDGVQMCADHDDDDCLERGTTLACA